MWVGQAEFIYFLGELSWGSGFIYIFPYPHILNISNGENGSLAHGLAQSFEISLKINGHRFETDLIRAGQQLDGDGGSLFDLAASHQVGHLMKAFDPSGVVRRAALLVNNSAR